MAIDHDCDKDPIIQSQGRAIDAITASMNQAVEQLKNVARLLEQNAEVRTDIKHLDANLGEHRRHVEKEQEAQWRRIDETIGKANAALSAAADAANAAKSAADAAKAAAELAGEAKKTADKVESTPGKVALKSIGLVLLAALSALLGALL